MSVHQFPPDRSTPLDRVVVDDFDDFDDPEYPDPFDSFIPWRPVAHRAVNPAIVSWHSDVPLVPCQEFHHALFSLIEAVGDFDGVIATSQLVVAPRLDQLDSVERWAQAHQPPDIDAIYAASEFDDDVDWDQLFERAIGATREHDLALSSAVDTNPSFTFGSVRSLVDRLDDNILELEGTSCRQYTEAMTSSALSMLGSMPDLTIVGDVHVRGRRHSHHDDRPSADDSE